VFVLGQSFGSVVYIRNLALIRREKRLGHRDPGEHPQETHPQTTT
jgi:hypothetical protein